MCYKVKLRSGIKELQERYDALFADEPEQLPECEEASGFDHPRLPIITSEDPDQIRLMEWGMVPAWIKNEEDAVRMRNATLNARSETLFEKPSFKSIVKKRCLVPVNGFYEWQQIAKQKVPYYIHLKSVNLFTLGGLYDEWVNTDTGEIYKGFSLITVPANPLMAVIHNSKKRMPFIVPREIEKQWLYADIPEGQIKNMISQYPEQDMDAEQIKEKGDNLLLWN